MATVHYAVYIYKETFIICCILYENGRKKSVCVYGGAACCLIRVGRRWCLLLVDYSSCSPQFPSRWYSSLVINQHRIGTTSERKVSSKRKLEEGEKQVYSPSSPDQQWKKDETDCMLSLSLNTVGKRRCLLKGNTCSNSETSETVSCHSRANFAESLVPCIENSSVNLDLSISMYCSSVEHQ